MYIYLEDSRTKGFSTWADTDQPGDSNDGHDSESAAVDIADPDLDDAVMAPPEQPHRPWLVPGAGRL